MKRIISFALVAGLAMLAACTGTTPDSRKNVALVDSKATAETRALYRNLLALRGQHTLFGHQDTLAYGLDWTHEPDRSDVKDVSGSFAAVSGWDIGWLEKGSAENLDGVRFDWMRDSIKNTFRRGGVTTISWHMINPVSGGGYNDTAVPAVADVLPGGDKHELFKRYLDTFVEFNQSLVVDGVQVPVIFRPWHEHNGEWFWWGKGRCTEEEYIRLWRFTVEYLRDEKQQHNLIYAFSPDRSRMTPETMVQDYFYGYPGDDYVDVFGMDNYWDLGHPANEASADEQLRHFTLSLATISRLAQARGKLASLTEGGVESVPNPHFWTQVILRGINADPDAQGIAWVLVWRNATDGGYNGKHFYGPHAGHPSAADFVTFKEDVRILFEDELPALYR